MTFLLSFPELPLVESQRREVEVLVLRTICLFLILEGLLGGGGPCSLVLFQNCPMFPCSHVPTRFHNLFSFLKFAYDVFFVLAFVMFCSPIPKKWADVPCSLRYFGNVPLFRKTPGRPSSLSIHHFHHFRLPRNFGNNY